jgi:(heptosyl)LPS beta-1,4-glucosyltransferase
MGAISVVINTLNEEKNLPRALASIKNIADEIVVCDMHSEDKTSEIAKKAGAKVYQYKRTGYVEPARNYAISKAKSNWILILDADEEITNNLSKSLRKIVKKPSADYYRLPRKNIIFGKWIKHSRWWPDYNIRFFKKGHVSWSEIIHSVPITTGKGLDLEAKEANAIVHYHYETIEQYIQRLNRYTTQHAKLNVKEGYKFKWRDLIKKPIDEFLSRYFQGQGYKDGLHGLALAGLQGISEFVMYLKIWQGDNFSEKNIEIDKVVDTMKEMESDIHYWQADSLLKEVGGVKNRLKRKFKL